MKLYCVVDIKAKSIVNIFQSVNDEGAERSFLMLLTGIKSVFTDFPEDFAVYPLGELFYDGVLHLQDPKDDNLRASGFKVQSYTVPEPLKRGSDYDRRYLKMVRLDREDSTEEEDLNEGGEKNA